MTNTFEQSNLFQATYAYVQQYMSRYDCSHDFSHVQRVLALAKHILAEELKLRSELNVKNEVVILAALLHDVGDRKYTLPGEDSERPVVDFLADQGCPSSMADAVSIVVEHVSFSKEIKNAKLIAKLIEVYPELAIVQDADRLDAIGAIGIGRCFAYGAAKQPDRGLEGSVDHFTEKLERLEGMMKTETGRKLANERTRRIKEFKKWWSEEQSLFS